MVNEEKELDDYLEGNSELSNQYYASAMVEPSERLNEKILSAAKDAVIPKHKKKVLVHKSPWVRPVSIAAMITLSVSLVVTMQQESGQPLISAPELSIEPHSSTALSEEIVMPQTVTADDDILVLDELELRQRNGGRADVPTASGAVGSSRSESNTDVMKDEAAIIKPAKKGTLKQKARSKETEKRVFAKEHLLKSAPMEADVAASVNFKPDLQVGQGEKSLLKIKSMWEAGKYSEAKKGYQEFYKTHPGFSVEKIKEILGPDLYQALIL